MGTDPSLHLILFHRALLEDSQIHLHIDPANKLHLTKLELLRAYERNATKAVDSAKKLARELVLDGRLVLKCNLVPSWPNGGGVMHQIEWVIASCH